jgi:hypothetical protein
MALGKRKPIQSSLSLRYKLFILAFMNLTGKDSESHAIRSIIEDKFDKLPIGDKIRYWRYIEKHFPDESKDMHRMEG